MQVAGILEALESGSGWLWFIGRIPDSSLAGSEDWAELIRNSK